ncbi:hypothetical protein [Paenibacillus sp. 481]|uniref:hypothetical protein n=1 Tax=Paenibacillus sp. 481 TaxID=2835869 RepID=UPI001E29CC39|nr:hypothetical protein [Paenibacillus sp. 481]
MKEYQATMVSACSSHGCFLYANKDKLRLLYFCIGEALTDVAVYTYVSNDRYLEEIIYVEALSCISIYRLPASFGELVAIQGAAFRSGVKGNRNEMNIKNVWAKRGTLKVSNQSELLIGLKKKVPVIEITQTLKVNNTITIPEKVTLKGATTDTRIIFEAGMDGIEVTNNNTLSDLCIEVSPKNRAIFNSYNQKSMGNLKIKNVKTIGSVQILAKSKIQNGHIEMINLHIIEADVLNRMERPEGFGVSVIQGALTIWNQQQSKDSVLSVSINGIQIGGKDKPVLGSGIFLSGYGPNALPNHNGILTADVIDTDEIHSTGKIRLGISDVISGGLFIVHGVKVKNMTNRGTVTTYGVNDMVLDNWGEVSQWIAKKSITSHGASGIGFVNFGKISVLTIQSTIETFGQGARGFNAYTGDIGTACFKKVITHGDGAIGIQTSTRIDRLIVNDGIFTYGNIGDSLVEGIIKKIPAQGLSILKGTKANSFEIHGGIHVKGKDVDILNIENNAAIKSLMVKE